MRGMQTSFFTFPEREGVGLLFSNFLLMHVYSQLTPLLLTGVNVSVFSHFAIMS